MNHKALSAEDKIPAGAAPGQGRAAPAKPLPADAVIVIPMRNTLLFPGVISPITVERPSSIAAAQEAVRSERKIGFLLQRSPDTDDVKPDDLYWIGTAGGVVRYITGNEGTHHLVVQGHSRFRVLEFLEGWPFLVARVTMIDAKEEMSPEIEARFLQLKEQAAEAIQLLANAPEELALVVQGMTSPSVIAELRKAIDDAGMPEDVHKHALKELKRLERMGEGSAENSMLRTYLEWLSELPWRFSAVKEINISEARRVLDEDHYGLEKIKRRILEHLAVRKLNPEGKSPILCFVGPPGVGKTSLGQSIARATGRKFARLSLGGVHDEAEIRGHRRTYIGALPGNIVQSIRKAGRRNPVLMLDEVDKLGVGFHGDPSSALLEVLDPEQNSTFRDNYLGVTFDLSRVMFIATANVLDTVPGPVRDRMEVIELPGYTEDEKLEIARRYLLKRQLEANGLRAEQCEIAEDAIRSIIRDYTREAGVRNLERLIGAVCRHVAMQIAEGAVERMRIDDAALPAILGPRRFENEVAMRTSVPGVATGLAWTPTGGDILFIEATRVAGSGRLILTGQLGEVMKESAQAALTLAKARAAELGFDVALFEKSDIHIHVPAGAIPKDGPSAGVAMFVALASLLTGRTARNDTAMTGEISLRGLVLPIGGGEEKGLAAGRARVTPGRFPPRKPTDPSGPPEAARQQVRFVWLERVDDAVAAALNPPGTREEAESSVAGETSPARRAARSA